ncbi:unnamed protein product, partial [Polarella glacialis]
TAKLWGPEGVVSAPFVLKSEPRFAQGLPEPRLALVMCWRTTMRAVVGAMLIMGSCMEAAVFSDAEWSKTIDVAGTQRMLSQRMSKHFLLVATGINITSNK